MLSPDTYSLLRESFTYKFNSSDLLLSGKLFSWSAGNTEEDYRTMIEEINTLLTDENEYFIPIVTKSFDTARRNITKPEAKRLVKEEMMNLVFL